VDEDSLIKTLVTGLPVGVGTVLGPGDDAAIVAFDDGRVAITTDILVEGVHFRQAWSSGFDLGWRLAAQNLADAAAMGAVPRSLVVALAGPPGRLSGAWGTDFARGLGTYCRSWNVGVDGGDLSRGPVLVACGTALGDLEGRSPVKRSGARAGHTVALSGAVRSPASATDSWALGASAAGLAWLEAGAAGDSTVPARLRPLAEAAMSAYLRPDPPLDLGKSAALGGATAMMDISDGLGKDAARLARSSGVRLLIDPDTPALAGAIKRWQPLAGWLDVDPRQWVLGGGEDHAFLATFASENGLPEGWYGIGQVAIPGEDGPGVTFLGADVAGSGWDHFGSLNGS
jgi:thiamine-monophosphate kinase